MKADLQKQLNWDLKTESLKTNYHFLTEKKAILRNDNNELLGIVGKDYCPVTNTQLMSITDALTKTGEFELKGFDELNNGKTILAFLENKGSKSTMLDCKMREYLVIGNSHDGSRPFYVGTGSSLIRCENQFYSTLKVFRKKHTSPLQVDQFLTTEIMRTYKQKKKKVYEAFDGMENIRVDENVINRLVMDIHKMLATDSRQLRPEQIGWSPAMKTLRQCIKREMGDLGNNAFGLFNGVTWYTSHEMRNSNKDTSWLMGTANQINQKAYRFCNSLKAKENETIRIIYY